MKTWQNVSSFRQENCRDQILAQYEGKGKGSCCLRQVWIRQLLTRCAALCAGGQCWQEEIGEKPDPENEKMKERCSHPWVNAVVQWLWAGTQSRYQVSVLIFRTVLLPLPGEMGPASWKRVSCWDCGDERKDPHFFQLFYFGLILDLLILDLWESYGDSIVYCTI